MTDKDYGVELTATQKNILNHIQTEFPIDARPYKALAEKLGLSEEVVLENVRALRENGVIRRIGGNFTSRNIGYTSTLCAAKVPLDKFDAFVEKVNSYSGVTHNYRRNHDFNVWFTFIAESTEEIEQNLKDIAKETGVTEIYNLPAKSTYKIKVDFQFDN